MVHGYERPILSGGHTHYKITEPETDQACRILKCTFKQRGADLVHEAMIYG